MIVLMILLAVVWVILDSYSAFKQIRQLDSVETRLAKLEAAVQSPKSDDLPAGFSINGTPFFKVDRPEENNTNSP